MKKALDRAFKAKGEYLTITDAAEVIKHTAYKVTRVGEIIGNEVANRLNLPFGVADLSLAPTPAVGDSVGEIFQSLGLSSIGAPGTTAILAMLNDQVKKGGVFASSHVGGLSGAFIPVSEDSAIEAAARSGALTLEKLEAMTSVCSVGLDMIAIPGRHPRFDDLRHDRRRIRHRHDQRQDHCGPCDSGSGQDRGRRCSFRRSSR